MKIGFLRFQIIRILIHSTKRWCVSAGTFVCNDTGPITIFSTWMLHESPPFPTPPTTHPWQRSQWVWVENKGTSTMQQCNNAALSTTRNRTEMFWRAQPTSTETWGRVKCHLGCFLRARRKTCNYAQPLCLSQMESVDSLSVTLPSRRDLCVFAHVSCKHK